MDLQLAGKLAIAEMDKHHLISKGWTFRFDNAHRRFGLCTLCHQDNISFPPSCQDERGGGSTQHNPTRGGARASWERSRTWKTVEAAMPRHRRTPGALLLAGEWRSSSQGPLPRHLSVLRIGSATLQKTQHCDDIYRTAHPLQVQGERWKDRVELERQAAG